MPVTPSARITLDSAFRVAPISRRMFGSFIEHLGRAVYTGIFEPGHPLADEQGFRVDVLDHVRDLGVTTIRYPGGNFVSGYRWEDGVGPVAQRPRRLDLAWHSTEPNTFGLDEFMQWTARAGVEPMMAVNLGTRGVAEAVELLEYCNVDGGTARSDARRANGGSAPYGVRMWCLGNEMDGPWQIGHKTAVEYGRLAAETGRAMRMIDPDLTLVACGSSGAHMETFAAWEHTVLDLAYDQVDLISAHAYYWEQDGDLESFLASAVDLDGFIAAVVATADSVRAGKKRTKRIDISFDEWNVWYQNAEASAVPTAEWPIAPALLEDRYNIADAVVVGSLLISLLRNADRVAAASLAQLVNVIAPIVTEAGGPSWRQTTFHPFSQAAHLATGEALRAEIRSSVHSTEKFGDVTDIDAVATLDEDRASVLLVNRSTRPVTVTVDVRSLSIGGLRAATVLADADPRRPMDAVTARSVAPRALPAALEDGLIRFEAPSVSWCTLDLSRDEAFHA